MPPPKSIRDINEILGKEKIANQDTVQALVAGTTAGPAATAAEATRRQNHECNSTIRHTVRTHSRYRAHGRAGA
jgi:hypothetical protein